MVPNPLQSLAEFFVGTFDDLVKDALDIEDYRKYFPLICGLFMFLWLSNIWGIIPYFSEPTKDLNTPLGLGILGFVIAHYSGIRVKGFKEYAKEYFQPIFLMAPLNVIGELAKVVAPPDVFKEEGAAPDVAVDDAGVIFALDDDRKMIRIFEHK